MNKFKKWKGELKNPPIERLANIEYKSHFFQMAGITFASIILIWKGLWYVVFAFIFGIGISYSQGMSAYKRYQQIMKFKPQETYEEILKDISWTRRRSKIIKVVYGDTPLYACIFVSVILSVLIIDPTLSRLWLILLYPLSIFGSFFLMYFILFYSFASMWFNND